MKTNGLKAWLLASRPKTLTGAAAPVLVGGAMAFVSQLVSIVDEHERIFGEVRYGDRIFQSTTLSAAVPFVLCLLFAFLMQIDANFINDYYDFKKGTDRDDRLGPARACAQGWITPKAMFVGIVLTTILSCAVGALIMLWHLQWELLIVGFLCVVFSFLYTTKLSYLGWGDVLVLVFFGIVPVVFTYYVMTGGRCELSVVVASVAMGLATDNLLIVNNYRDRFQDEISEKKTIIVRMLHHCQKKYGSEVGKKRCESICQKIYLMLGIVAVVLEVVGIVLFQPERSTQGAVLLVVYVFLHIKAYKMMKKLDGRELNKLLGVTAMNIFLFGLASALGMLTKFV